MKKSLLKQIRNTIFYGAGRDALALTLAGILMLSESPLGFARYALAAGSDEDSIGQVEETTTSTTNASEGVINTITEPEPLVEEKPQANSQNVAPAQNETIQEPTNTNSNQTSSNDLTDGTIIVSTRLFGEMKFYKLFLVDDQGQVASESTPMPSNGIGITLTDENDWRFAVQPIDHYEIDSVAYKVEGNDTEVKLTAKNGIYAIPREVITQAHTDGKTLTLVVKTHATEVTVAAGLKTCALYAVSSTGSISETAAVTPGIPSFNIPADKEYRFKPVPLADYTIESVSATVGTTTEELQASENGIYTISLALVQASAESGDPVELVVKTSQDEGVQTDSNLPVPIGEESSVVSNAEDDPSIEAENAQPTSAREFNHNLEVYLNKHYDTSVYGVSSIAINGTPIDEVDSIAYGDNIELKLAWGFPNSMAVKAGDQFTYQLPESIGWAFESGAAQGGVYDENGVQVGAFAIDSNGLATITYTSDLGSNVVGTFTATGVITRITNVGDNALVTFSLAGKDWKLHYISREAKVEVTKTGGDYIPSSGDYTLRQFTIQVLSLGDNQDIVVSDTPSTVTINKETTTSLELLPESVEVFSDAECTQRVNDGRVTLSDVRADGSFDILISEMADFESLYIRYQSRITLAAYNAAIGRSWNHAVGGPGDGYDLVSRVISNTATVTSTETSSVDVPSFLPSYIRQKTGSYDKESNSITWTVIAVTGDNTLSLKDTPGTGLQAIQDIQLFESSDGGKNYTSVDLSVAQNLTTDGLMDGTATLPASTTAGGKRFFKITYVTPVTPYAVGQTSYENWIAGNGRTFTSGKGLGAWVTVNTGTQVKIEKTSVPNAGYVNYNENNEIVGTPENIHWVSHLSVPTSETPYTNFVITDTENNGSDQQLIESTLHVYSDVERKNDITSQFTVTFNHATNRSEEYCSGFTLMSDTYKGGELYITIDASIVRVTKNRGFSNKISVDASEFAKKETTGSYNVYGHRLSKRWEPDLAGPDGWRGSGWSHTNSNTGRVTWTVQVSGLGNGELDLNPALTVTDTAPDRLVVDPDSFRFTIGYVDGWHTVVSQPNGNKLTGIEANVNGGTITFNIAPGSDAYEALRAGKSIVLVYDTTYNPDYSSDGFSVQAEGDKVVNNVSLSFGDGTYDTVSSSFTFKHQELLTKDAVYNESTAPNAIFTIQCNYWGGDLDPNSDYLTLTDVAGSALSINTNSITVTTYDSTGKIIDDAVPITDMASKGFSYTRNTKTGVVTFTVPDSLHFALSYESLVTLAPGATIEDESASNSVTLAGYTTPITTSIGSQVYASRATTTSLGYGVSVEKIDADYTSVHVADATYAVERVDVSKAGDAWTATGFTEIGRVTTAESGFSQALTGLAADQVYRLREVDSPVGYELSDDVFYLVFQGAQGEETVDYSGVTLTDDTGASVELEVYTSDSAVKRILMSDHQTPGALTITKTSEGTTTPADTSFTITGPNNYSRTVHYSEFSDGVLTIDDLVPGSYTVTEDVNSAKKDSYELVVYSGETIANTQTVTVEAGATGEAAAQVSFRNEYTRKETEVQVAKTWVGPIPEGAAVTVHLLADGERLDPDVTLELSEANDWHDTFRGLPIYAEDDATHEISYSVEEDALEGYTTTYAGDAATGYTITNTFDAHVTISATKYAFGQQGTYSFTLVGADPAGNVRSSAAGSVEGSEGIVDFGQALNMSATNGGFVGTRSTVSFPEISYREPGDYYYLLSEDAVAGQPHDSTVYLVHVAIGGDTGVSVEYTPMGLGATSSSAEFYNNGGLMLFGMSAGFATESAATQVASFQPVAHKELDGRALTAGEFSFLLLDEEGNAISEATNDVDGVVAFDRISYTDAGTYHYTMVEENTGQVGVDYDLSEHSVEVTVEADESGTLSVSSVTYDGEDAEPTFQNAVQVVIVRIRKVSRDGTGDPLFNSVYGLWIEGTDGASDIYLGNDASDEDGYIYIENVPVVEGATYYFKEESAPEGHLVDPYRIAHFRIDRAADGSYVLVSLEN